MHFNRTPYQLTCPCFANLQVVLVPLLALLGAAMFFAYTNGSVQPNPERAATQDPDQFKCFDREDKAVPCCVWQVRRAAQLPCAREAPCGCCVRCAARCVSRETKSD